MSLNTNSTRISFPNELLYKIFLDLDFASLMNLKKTCKQFELVVDDQYFWNLWYKKYLAFPSSKYKRSKIIRRILQNETEEDFVFFLSKMPINHIFELISHQVKYMDLGQNNDRVNRRLFWGN